MTTQGLGASVPCTQSLKAAAAPAGGASSGIPIMRPGNHSDVLEPSILYPGWSDVITFANGFTAANSPDVSTCGDPARAVPVNSTYLTLWVNFNFQGIHTVLFHMPLIEEEFVYSFPANFGTWAIDNLSAPGGPGGGWAFDYLGPCV